MSEALLTKARGLVIMTWTALVPDAQLRGPGANNEHGMQIPWRRAGLYWRAEPLLHRQGNSARCDICQVLQRSGRSAHGRVPAGECLPSTILAG